MSKIEMITYVDGLHSGIQTLSLDQFLEKFPEEGPRLLKTAKENATKREIMLNGRTEVQKKLAGIFKEELEKYKKEFPNWEDIDLENLKYYM